MKRRYALAALGYLLYLKMNAEVKLFETVCCLTGPIGGIAFAQSGKIPGKSFFATYQMLMPFIVRPIWLGEERLVVARVEPARHAGDHGFVELLGVVERVFGFRRVDRDRVVRIGLLAAERPQDPMRPAVRVADGVTQREAGRMTVLLQRARELEQPVEVFRKLVEARFVHPLHAVVDRVARAADRQRDPALHVLVETVRARVVVVAAVRLAHVVDEVRHVDQLVGIDERVVVPTHDDIWAGADLRGERRLRRDVGPAQRLDRHGDAGCRGELLRVLRPDHVVCFDEACPAQQLQRRALLGLERRRVGGRRERGERPGQRGRTDAGGG